jgi:hypothetical protein
VFGRIGSRPFTWEEMKRFYQRPDGTVWTVSDTPRAADFVPTATVATGTQDAAAPTK